jgi:hypothetical protein
MEGISRARLPRQGQGVTKQVKRQTGNEDHPHNVLATGGEHDG